MSVWTRTRKQSKQDTASLPGKQLIIRLQRDSKGDVRPSTHSECVLDQEKWQVCVFHVSDYKATSKWPSLTTSLTCLYLVKYLVPLQSSVISFYFVKYLVPLQSSVISFYFECCRSGLSPSKTTKTQTDREAKKQDLMYVTVMFELLMVL